MQHFPEKAQAKLDQRTTQNALRQLPDASNLIDFASNDYLGFARSEALFAAAHELLIEHGTTTNGATGSRLITGNHSLYRQAEDYIAGFHQSESALLFNSGYDANVGLLSALPQKDEVILFDELCHASIRDGIRLSNAKSYKFGHNDVGGLNTLLEKNASASAVYIVTESVFSMDGDSPNLEELTAIAAKHNAYLIVDEAHALGVFGEKGEGLVQQLGLQDRVFARVMTFGKGLGCHGAVIIGSQTLRQYLVNFARSFIYTTGLPPHSVATLLSAYRMLSTRVNDTLRQHIACFNRQKTLLQLKPIFVYSKSSIQCAILPGNDRVKSIAQKMQSAGFDVRAILSPTVPEGQERLRICLHQYNSEAQITRLLETLAAAL